MQARAIPRRALQTHTLPRSPGTASQTLHSSQTSARRQARGVPARGDGPAYGRPRYVHFQTCNCLNPKDRRCSAAGARRQARGLPARAGGPAHGAAHGRPRCAPPLDIACGSDPRRLAAPGMRGRRGALHVAGAPSGLHAARLAVLAPLRRLAGDRPCGRERSWGEMWVPSWWKGCFWQLEDGMVHASLLACRGCPPAGCLAVLSRLHQLAMGPCGRVLG